MKWKKIVALIMGVVVLGALSGCGISQDDLATQLEEQKESLQAEQDLAVQNLVSQQEVAVNEMVEEMNKMTVDQTALTAEQARLQAVIDDYEAEADTEETAIASAVNGFLLDEILIGEDFTFELSDRELEGLFDVEVEFKDDDYDAEEVVNLAGNLAVNEEDFEGNAFVLLDKSDFTYDVVFDAALNTDLITEDDSLVFDFLGESVELVDWDVDSVTFIQGETHVVEETQKLEIDGHTVNIKMIVDDYVYLVVDGEGEKIHEGENVNIEGLDIRVEEVLDDDDGADFATIRTNGDVSKTIEDGDDFDDTERFEWVVGSNSLGLTLNQEFNELDDELKPFGLGEGLCLPNNHICFVFNGLSQDDGVELNLELDDVDGSEYVEVDGEFVLGLESYEIVLVNATGIYDEDFVLLGTGLEIEDTDFTLNLTGTNLVIDDIVIPLLLNDVTVAGNNESSFDDDFRNVNGLLLTNPEDAVEDNEFTLLVPEEALEGTISVE